MSEKKTLLLAALRPVSDELKKGLPLFLDQLILVLGKNQSIVGPKDESRILSTAGIHGKELLRLGYTLSHVVHAYGAMCQSITEIATKSQSTVTPMEFHNLNRCLDLAIAGAVTEYESTRNIATRGQEVAHLGELAHELRNALNRALVSSEMISKGLVGAGGSTSKVLELSLMEMHRLIGRSLSEVRLRAESELHEEKILILDLINQLVVTAEVEATLKNQTLTTQIDPNLCVKTDRHIFFAAIGNVVQNAMKFTPEGENVKITARAENSMAVIEVEDRCGGIPEDKLNSIFKPFMQHSKDRTGLGLGLTIVKNSIKKCSGTIEVQNVPNGCLFKIKLPIAQ